MPDSFHDHLDVDVAERHVAGELTETELAVVEEHLLVCETCRQTVSEMDVFAPLLRSARGGSAAYSHATADGPVVLEIDPLPDSKWSARIHGSRLEGRAYLGSPREAYAYLRRSFAEMFPEHLCDEGCGPVD
jgi:anti-sigma factor RsiW